MAREPPWEQNVIHHVDCFGYIWEHELSWAFARLLVICVSPDYQVVDEFSPCVLWPFMTGLMAVPQTFFSYGEYGFTYEGLMLFKGMNIEFKDNYVGILQENEM